MGKRRKYAVLLLALALCLPVFAHAEAQVAGPKTLYFNANFFTNDRQVPTAEAVVVEDGKFAFVGAHDEAQAYAGADCDRVDLEGQFVTPGFFDAHIHMGMRQEPFDFRDYIADETPTVDQLVEALTKFLAAHPDIQYLRGAGWDNTSFPGGSPTKEILDAINAEIPITLRSLDYHSVWVNSKALEMAGVTAETEVPDGKGTIDLNEKGEVSGTLREPAAMNLVLDKLPPITVDEYKAAILKTQDLLLSYGTTGAFDALVYPDSSWYQAYRELSEAGELKMRVNIAIVITNDGDYKGDIEWTKREIDKYKDQPGQKMAITACKFLSDGVVEGGTAYLEAAYHDNPGYTGIPIWDEANMADAFKLCDQYGIQIHVHSIGDAAVSMALDCMEGLSTDHRNALCHLQLVDAKDFQRFVDMGVVAVVAPYWAFRSDGYEEAEDARLGMERVNQTYPVKTFLDNGIITAAHSDYPITDVCNPLHGIETAVTRSRPAAMEDGRPASDSTLNLKEAVTIEQAIDIFTGQGAHANFLEAVTGSIAVGKSADFAVIDRDILSTPASLATVTATYFEGQLVFAK